MGNIIEAFIAYNKLYNEVFQDLAVFGTSVVKIENDGDVKNMTREEIHRMLFDPSYSTQQAAHTPVLGISPLDNWATCERDGGYPFLANLPYIFHTEGIYTCEYKGIKRRGYYKVGDILKSEHFIYNGPFPEEVKIGSDWTTYLPTGMSIDESKLQPFVFSRNECDHKWKSYVGLFEAYDFCEKCDKKRETK